MGNIFKAISDDIEEYEWLCRKYKEKVQNSHGSPDCYGEHASALKKRHYEEMSVKRDANVPTIS